MERYLFSIERGEKLSGLFEYGKENLVHEICCHIFEIPYEETGFQLTFSFT